MWKERLLTSSWKFSDVVSAHKINQLNRILPHPSLLHNHLPLLYHFIFLTPSSATKELDEDGYDSYQSPPSFKRRLWVGGLIKQYKPIIVGTDILLHERIKRVREINGATIIEIERSIENDCGTLLTETRKLMYLDSTYIPISGRVKQLVPIFSESVQLTALDLMRYSALTYNSHKIHFDRDYTTNIEMYPNILIHGPLLVTLSINFLSQKVPQFRIQNILYKNIQPLFVHDILILNITEQDHGYEVWINNAAGEVCCSSVIS